MKVPRNAPELSVVVPFFNEAENVRELHRRLSDSLDPAVDGFELVFVDDGSRDATPEILDELHALCQHVTVIHLSRNFGHQAAITAGLRQATGDGVIVMDGDMQDPPEVLPDFVAAWRRGYDVVYAIRTKRKEGALKRLGYYVFYRMLRAISDIDIPLDSGDFCLMDRKVVDALQALPEQLRFVRGLRTFVGFRQMGLQYERAARAAGRPKYTLTALIRLAVDGLISFSNYPLRVASYFGFTGAAVSLLFLAWVLFDAVHSKTAPQGWASTLVILMFMGSLQLISLGIMGEYIRRIFVESKHRPAYIVETVSPARAPREEQAPAAYPLVREVMALGNR